MSEDRPRLDRFVQESEAEQARLSAELEQLLTRCSVADDERHKAEEHLRARFVELTAAARAELDSIEAAHMEAMAALRSASDSGAPAVEVEVSERPQALGANAPEGS